ncbi:hypothetical protein BY458DRAFT_436186 [Sporodiniella umbellata]|nr:hypothetical protein BY458DRAFT_436186 [Sporodiniella umbellata]
MSKNDRDLFGLDNDSEQEENASLDEQEEEDTRFSRSKLQSSSFDSDASSDEDQNEEDSNEDDSDDEELGDKVLNNDAEDNDDSDNGELSDMEGYDAPTDLTEFGEMSKSKKGKEKKKIKALTPEELKKFEKARKKTGVCYLSRIPLFMPPSRVRELFKKHGEIGRIYLVPEDQKVTAKRKKYTKNNRRNYIEGWVEFKDKDRAKAVAEHLNMREIGGKRSSRYYAEMWNIKYLPKFKWHHLTEQMAHEKQAQQQRLRNEIAQANRENKIYLQNVEKAKMLENMKQKKRKREGVQEEDRVKRTFQQRDKVSREVAPVEDSVKGLLGSIFAKK